MNSSILALTFSRRLLPVIIFAVSRHPFFAEIGSYWPPPLGAKSDTNKAQREKKKRITSL